MDLLLVRHAIAESGGSGPDAARRLTEEGRARFELCVAGLSSVDIRLDAILHSPLVRAVETAALLRPLLVGGGSTERCDELAEPPDRPLLQRLTSERMALVGHEPWMGELTALLVTGRQEGGAFEFRKGGVALLTGTPSPGRMTLVMLLPPRALTRIG